MGGHERVSGPRDPRHHHLWRQTRYYARTLRALGTGPTAVCHQYPRGPQRRAAHHHEHHADHDECAAAPGGSGGIQHGHVARKGHRLQFRRELLQLPRADRSGPGADLFDATGRVLSLEEKPKKPKKGFGASYTP